MATMYKFLPSASDYYAILQERVDEAERHRHQYFTAVVLLQRVARGYLIRKHVAWLAKNATIIQCAVRKHQAKKVFRALLQRKVREKHAKHYNIAATRIQALWRGFHSRKVNFCYAAYRRWLVAVAERSDRKCAEAAEFGMRSRVINLEILEDEARRWLAFVVFKLHHLLRTQARAGIYSDITTTELTEFEKLLASIKYTEYMKTLRKKYDQFVRKHRPAFSNKRLFPVIGEGEDYWYLSLSEMYELTKADPIPKNTRHMDTHRGAQHERPFLWRRVRAPPLVENSSAIMLNKKARTCPCAPEKRHPNCPACPSTPHVSSAGAAGDTEKDPRFHLYCRYYTPEPNILDYVDFHINALLKIKNDFEGMKCEEKQHTK